jgi:hypothetical protein
MAVCWRDGLCPVSKREDKGTPHRGSLQPSVFAGAFILQVLTPVLNRKISTARAPRLMRKLWASRFAFSSTFRAEVFSEAVANDFEDGRVIHESMERFCPGSTADDNDIFRRIEC